MVDEEKYCIDILTQVSAMTKALQAVSLGLLEEHLSHCVVAAARAGGREADEKVREATDVDVEAGKVTVKSHEPLDREAVRAAVDEAGYTVVS